LQRSYNIPDRKTENSFFFFFTVYINVFVIIDGLTNVIQITLLFFQIDRMALNARRHLAIAQIVAYTAVRTTVL